MKSRVLTLRIPESSARDFPKLSALVGKALEKIETLPILPREAEDILGITSTERHRWLKDGRLRSAGTRTVQLRGRARSVTFHVFAPQDIEDILDRHLVDTWREDDAVSAAEARRRAAWKARLTRQRKTSDNKIEGSDTGLVGWDEFEREGLLRASNAARR